MKIGSLFSGYEGLGMGVQAVLGGDIAWVSDIDPGACKILAHRYPDVPNIGDITTVDWSAVEPVDVLTGGFPCQDVSCAGLRKGMRPDTRSGLWTQMAYAIDQLRPSLVVIENVRGLLSAEAHSDLEPCSWCVGDGGGVPLRALGAVLGDLADIGYDASWQGLRAADVGAPHGRFRVFVTAWPADTASDSRRLGHGDDGTAGHSTVRGRNGARLAGGRGEPAWPARGSGLAAADSEGQRRREGWTEPAGVLGRSDDVLCGSSTLAHPGDDGREGRQERHQRTPGGLAASQRDDADRRAGFAADAQGGSVADLAGCDDSGRAVVGTRARAGHRDGTGSPAAGVHELAGSAGVAWGPYAPAIARWERLTRPAPAPTEPGKTGQPRLSPAFVEWMQGLPAGWVTDVPGLTRNEMLKALGNGVVWQQCAAALRLLLPAGMENVA